MAHYFAAVTSGRTQQETWDYLADFRSCAEWDPSITSAELVTGVPGLVGACFAITLKQLAREQTLFYECIRAERPHLLVYRAETPSVISTDTITVEPDATVTYDAQIELKGMRKVADPVLQVLLDRASDKARDGLAETLRS